MIPILEILGYSGIYYASPPGHQWMPGKLCHVLQFPRHPLCLLRFIRAQPHCRRPVARNYFAMGHAYWPHARWNWRFCHHGDGVDSQYAPSPQRTWPTRCANSSLGWCTVPKLSITLAAPIWHRMVTQSILRYYRNNLRVRYMGATSRPGAPLQWTAIPLDETPRIVWVGDTAIIEPLTMRSFAWKDASFLAPAITMDIAISHVIQN